MSPFTFIHIFESLLFLPIAWLECLINPFFGFRPGNKADYVASALIVNTVILLSFRHANTPYPKWWIRIASALTFLIAIAAPVAFLGVLYMLSWRAQTLLGRWPWAFGDSPRFICHGDVLYAKLQEVTWFIEGLTGSCIYAWAGLVIHLRRSISKKQLLWHIGVFFAAWLVFVCEPTGRCVWWFD